MSGMVKNLMINVIRLAKYTTIMVHIELNIVDAQDLPR